MATRTAPRAPSGLDRRARPARAIRLLAGGAAIVFGMSLAVVEGVAAIRAVPTERASFSTTVLELSDDDDASAMFTVSNLAPERPLTRCIAVSYRGPARAVVRLHGTSTGTGLEQALDMTVEAGSGGRFDDCGGFRDGTVLYQGSLTGFTTVHGEATSALHAFFPTQETETKAFRVSVALRDDPQAQGRTASATLTWDAAERSPAPPVPPAPVPPGPTPPAPKRPAPNPSGPAPSELTGPPSPAAASPEAPAEPAAARHGTSGSGTRAGTQPSVRTAPQPSTLVLAGRLAKEVSKKAAFPAVLFVLVGLFLLIQDRIDRKDPKLALAPVHAEPDLHFPSPGVPDR